MARTAGEFTTRVVGLDEFRKALKELGPQWPKEMGRANKETATIVADAARIKASALGGVHRHVASSIKASAAARHAKVVGSGPAFFGAEFGAKRYSQFPPWRGNQWAHTQPAEGVGYMVQPAARDKAAEVLTTYGAAIRRIAAAAFPD